MEEAIVLSTVDTKSSKRKSLSYLMQHREEIDSVFLPLPVEHEAFIQKISKGINADSIINELIGLGLVSPPYDTQMCRSLKPVLQSISQIGLPVYCYVNSMHNHFYREAVEELLLLTFKAKIGKIKLAEWEKTLKKLIETNKVFSRDECEYILSKKRKKPVLFDLNYELAEELKRRIGHIDWVVIDESWKPLDILTNLLRRKLSLEEKIEKEVFIQLVKDHLEFVDLILKSKDFDEAYEKWIRIYPSKAKQFLN